VRLRVTPRGIHCLARDGHFCLSLDEQRIDNWLTEHHLDHEREPLYPQDASYNPNEKLMADWKVGDVYIEYFGLTGNEAYDKKSIDKIMLAKSVDIPLLAIYPEDMLRLDEALDALT
jgi:hypothetical protein